MSQKEDLTVSDEETSRRRESVASLRERIAPKPRESVNLSTFLHEACFVNPKKLFSYNRLPDEVLHNSKLGASDKVVMSRLFRLSHMTEGKPIRVRIGKLAVATGQSSSTVQRSITRLESAQVIEVTRRPNASSRYSMQVRGNGHELYIPDWLSPLRRVPASAKLIYAAVAQRIGPHGIAFLSNADIVEATRLSRTTVINQLRWLEENQWVYRDTQGARTIYVLDALPEMNSGVRSDADPVISDGFLMNRSHLADFRKRAGEQ